MEFKNYGNGLMDALNLTLSDSSFSICTKIINRLEETHSHTYPQSMHSSLTGAVQKYTLILENPFILYFFIIIGFSNK